MKKTMNRKEVTRLLTEVLIADRLSDRKYYAKEVTLDYGTDHSKRIDVVQFQPKGVVYASDIEKGTFTCYEIKSCVEDVYSGNGLNFYGEKNYIVTTMETYKSLRDDINSGKLARYICDNYPESSKHYGFMVAVPSTIIDLKDTKKIYEEYESPSAFEGESFDWKMYTIMPCNEGRRSRSTTELMFCMLRSKHSGSNFAGGQRYEWLETRDKNKKMCSRCGVIHLIAQYPFGKASYCPNCGAKMEG